MPPCRANRIRPWIFDPKNELFKGGAHMPLLVYFGTKVRPSDRGWEKIREKKDKRRQRQAEKTFQKAAAKAAPKQQGPGWGREPVP
jgi:hypothetical protein